MYGKYLLNTSPALLSSTNLLFSNIYICKLSNSMYIN